jgi:Fe-S-cluster containining protein
MKHGEDGWCVALDRTHMNCGIYEMRPAVCRRFAMNGPYCKAIYADWNNAVAANPRRAPVA